MPERPDAGTTVVAEEDDVRGGCMLVDVVVLADGSGAGEVVVVEEVLGSSGD